MSYTLNAGACMSWFGILHWNAAAGFQGWAQTRGQKRQALGCQGGLPA